MTIYRLVVKNNNKDFKVYESEDIQKISDMFDLVSVAAKNEPDKYQGLFLKCVGDECKEIKRVGNISEAFYRSLKQGLNEAKTVYQLDNGTTIDFDKIKEELVKMLEGEKTKDNTSKENQYYNQTIQNAIDLLNGVKKENDSPKKNRAIMNGGEVDVGSLYNSNIPGKTETETVGWNRRPVFKLESYGFSFNNSIEEIPIISGFTVGDFIENSKTEEGRLKNEKIRNDQRYVNGYNGKHNTVQIKLLYAVLRHVNVDNAENGVLNTESTKGIVRVAGDILQNDPKLLDDNASHLTYDGKSFSRYDGEQNIKITKDQMSAFDQHKYFDDFYYWDRVDNFIRNVQHNIVLCLNEFDKHFGIPSGDYAHFGRFTETPNGYTASYCSQELNLMFNEEYLIKNERNTPVRKDYQMGEFRMAVNKPAGKVFSNLYNRLNYMSRGDENYAPSGMTFTSNGKEQDLKELNRNFDNTMAIHGVEQSVINKQNKEKEAEKRAYHNVIQEREGNVYEYIRKILNNLKWDLDVGSNREKPEAQLKSNQKTLVNLAQRAKEYIDKAEQKNQDKINQINQDIQKIQNKADILKDKETIKELSKQIEELKGELDELKRKSISIPDVYNQIAYKCNTQIAEISKQIKYLPADLISSGGNEDLNNTIAELQRRLEIQKDHLKKLTTEHPKAKKAIEAEEESIDEIEKQLSDINASVAENSKTTTDIKDHMVNLISGYKKYHETLKDNKDHLYKGAYDLYERFIPKLRKNLEDTIETCESKDEYQIGTSEWKEQLNKIFGKIDKEILPGFDNISEFVEWLKNISDDNNDDNEDNTITESLDEGEDSNTPTEDDKNYLINNIIPGAQKILDALNPSYKNIVFSVFNIAKVLYRNKGDIKSLSLNDKLKPRVNADNHFLRILNSDIKINNQSVDIRAVNIAKVTIVDAIVETLKEQFEQYIKNDNERKTKSLECIMAKVIVATAKLWKDKNINFKVNDDAIQIELYLSSTEYLQRNYDTGGKKENPSGFKLSKILNRSQGIFRLNNIDMTNKIDCQDLGWFILNQPIELTKFNISYPIANSVVNKYKDEAAVNNFIENEELDDDEKNMVDKIIALLKSEDAYTIEYNIGNNSKGSGTISVTLNHQIAMKFKKLGDNGSKIFSYKDAQGSVIGKFIGNETEIELPSTYTVLMMDENSKGEYFSEEYEFDANERFNGVKSSIEEFLKSMRIGSSDNQIDSNAINPINLKKAAQVRIINRTSKNMLTSNARFSKGLFNEAEAKSNPNAKDKTRYEFWTLCNTNPVLIYYGIFPEFNYMKQLIKAGSYKVWRVENESGEGNEYHVALDYNIETDILRYTGRDMYGYTFEHYRNKKIISEQVEFDNFKNFSPSLTFKGRRVVLSADGKKLDPKGDVETVTLDVNLELLPQIKTETPEQPTAESYKSISEETVKQLLENLYKTECEVLGEEETEDGLKEFIENNLHNLI